MRGLGIASATRRLVAALVDEHDLRLKVNASGRGWSRTGQIETVLRSGLLDISPKMDLRTWTSDVVHYFGNTAPQLMNDSCVVTVHDLMSTRGVSRKARLYTQLLVPGLKRGHHGVVVAISRQTADDIVVAIPHLASRLQVIPHGRRPGLYVAREREHILMFGGSGDPRKRTGLGLAGYQSYQRRAGAGALPLIVAGRAGVDPALIPHVDKSGLVTIEPDPSDARMLELLATAAAVLYPTCEEGYGLPILEAGEVGTPVICDVEARIPTEPMGAHVFSVRGEDSHDWGAAIERAVRCGPTPDAIPHVPTWADVAKEYGRLYRSLESHT